MPGYSRLFQWRTRSAWVVESIDPDGNPVTTSLVQCNECGAVITAAFTDQHERDHESRAVAARAAQHTPDKPGFGKFTEDVPLEPVLSDELREQIQRDREHPEQMVARPKRGAAKSD